MGLGLLLSKNLFTPPRGNRIVQNYRKRIVNKGEFGKEFSRIVKKYPCNMFIPGEDASFVLQACCAVQRYSKIALDPTVKVKCGWHTIANGRKVKMIFLWKSREFQIPVSKSVVVETIYPKKKRISSVEEPEKNHRSKVISAMRNMVSYQLSEYRNSLSFPLMCWRSGKKIIKGMKCDVDHIGEPFIKIVDDFLVSKNLVFTGIILAGRANDKRFKSEELCEEWKLFHEERAILALVLSGENRSAGSGGYEPREDILGSFKKVVDLNFG